MKVIETSKAPSPLARGPRRGSHAGVVILPAHSKSTPQSFLQLIKSFDDVFLHQVLTLGDYRLPAHHHFADRGARS
jgi:hypothetical protein